MDEVKTPKAGGITPVIELGGRIWQLKVTHSVLQRFAAMTRCNLMQMQAMMGRYDMMTMMLWLMLCETDPGLKREQLDAWLNDLPVFEAMELVMSRGAEAFQAAFPESKQEDEEGSGGEKGEEPEDPTV